jgi:uncharacterized membrane protein
MPDSSLQFENVAHAWLWLALIAGGAWVLFATYRGIFERSARRLTWGLMGLRGAGLLALVAALAKPTWTHQSERVDPARLAVVVDNSASMSLADPAGGSRYTWARDAVGRLQDNLAASTSGGGAAVVDLFDISGSRIASELPAEPRLERTDLVRAATSAVAQLRSKPLAGLVLISDGMDNTGQADLQPLRELPVPIYSVGYQEDPDVNRMDLAVRGVTAPPRVMVNNEAQVSVLISKKSGPAVDVDVEIKRGRDQFASQRVSLAAGDVEQPVEIKLAPSQAGKFVFTASVRSDRAGERLAANNSRHFPMQVDSEPIRVLYVEGFLRNEHKFLKNRLEDDPDVSLVSLVRRANPELMQGTPAGDVLTAERLEKFDVVILGDMEAGYLSRSEYDALVAWVDDGHALLVLGGYQSFGEGGFRTTPLADMLPVTFAEQPPFQSEDPFVLNLTEAGRRHPIFKITSERVQDAAAWNSAPPLLGCSLVARAKPGADVLAVNPGFEVNGQPAVVIAAQRYGGGHALVITADTTWRWSRLVRVLGQADTLYARFWGQTVRWLAGREADPERPPIVVSTDRPDYDVGKPVLVRVSRQSTPESPVDAASVSVEVVDEAGKQSTLQMQQSSAEPDVLSASYFPSAGGRYQVHASLTADDNQVANQATEFLVHGSDLELAQAGTNRPLLQSIASATGGLYFDVQDAGKLIESIQFRERRTPRIERRELWNSPALFLIFLAAVTAEWLVRRRNHLV